MMFRYGLLAGMLSATPNGSAQTVLEQKPNLRPFPAYDLAVIPDFVGGKQLIFTTTSWNSGQGPLELVAGEIDTAGDKQNVYQRVYLDNGGFYDRYAGTFAWHAAHNHFHFGDYALYTLQPVNAPGASQRTSEKTTFCVIDTNPIDRSLPGAPQATVYDSCGTVVQGMSVGWADTYDRTLPGQEIDLTGLPDGDYRLVIEVDPKNRLIETNDGDNVACTLLHVSPTDSTVTVLDDSGCDVSGATVAITAINPAAARTGSVPVTITGSGFVPGMAVSFENGAGTRPTASNLVVRDANTITASVAVKYTKASKRDPVWDVRVGPALLGNGFRVLP
jgi:hypothetical protein